MSVHVNKDSAISAEKNLRLDSLKQNLESILKNYYGHIDLVRR